MGQAKARGPYAKTPARRAEIVRAARDSFAEVLADRDSEEWRQGVDEGDALDRLGPCLAELVRHHQKAPELMHLCIDLAAAASLPDRPAHTYFVERYDRSRTQCANGFPDVAARGRLREGVTPESAAVLFQAVQRWRVRTSSGWL